MALSTAEELQTLGIDLGEGEEIGMLYEGDHGGEYMLFIVVMLTHEGCLQKLHAVLGKFQAKESYSILANTVVPRIDAGIGLLNKLFCLVIEGPEGFDFAFVDKEKCGVVTSRSELPATLAIETPDGDVCSMARVIGTDETFNFHRVGAKRLSFLTGYKCLPIVGYNGSDLQYTAMVQGRPNHALSKCLTCDANKSTYKDCCCKGVDWMIERFDKEVKNYCIAHAPIGSPLLEGLSAEQIADIKATSIKESKISGITEYEVLFRNIESRNFVCPLLHIKLGIGNDLPNEIKEFISKELEFDLPYVHA